MRTVVILFVCLLGVCVPAVRADEVVPDTTRWLGEVSVTAIKNGTDISLQPMASTVVGQKEVERLNILTMKDVSEIAPNFYIPDYGSRMTSSIYIRGIGARIDQPVIGLNVDNVPFLNKDNYDFDVEDIERIEVLRGPQSTLYGRNTMGGLINIYTLSPLRYQGVRAMVEAGSGPGVRVALSGYRLLRENLGMSLSGYFNYSDGFFRNLHNGKKADRETGGSIRWKTAWQISDDVRLENAAAFTLARNSGYPYEYADTRQVNYNDTCFYRRNSISDGLTVSWTTDRFKLSSITSVQYLDDNMTLDQDFLPLDYFTLTQKRHEWAMTQDIVMRGETGRYKWLGGVFGFYKHTSMDAPVTFKDYGIDKLIVAHRNEINPDYPIVWDTPSFVLGSDFSYPVYGVAMYHQSTFDFGRWSVSGGVRLDFEHASLNYHSHTATGYTIYNCTDPDRPTVFRHEPIDIDDGGRLDKSFVQCLPKFTLSYRLPMRSPSDVYVSVGKGYKSGGYNTQMFSDVLQQRIMGLMGLGAQYDVDDIVSYKPEKSWNYEAGAHIVCGDGRVTTDLAAFYIDCRDQQLTMFPDGTTTGRITTNAGKTRSFGAEISIGYTPAERWHFNASYGYTNARFVKFFDGKTDYAHKYVPYAPANTVFGSVAYRLPVSKWIDNIVFGANVRGVGQIYWNESNDARQPFYALLGASVRFEHRRFSVDCWGENLTDRHFDTFSFVSIGNTFYQRGKPLRAGVTVRMNF